MLALAAWVEAAAQGARFAMQYNPLVALASAAVAAAVSGYPKAPRTRWRVSAFVVLAGWLVGDGYRVIGHAAELANGAGVLARLGAAAWAVLAVWAVGGLGCGYAVPALVGVRVGRGVRHGTGWLAAGVVAASASGALSVIVGALS